MTTKITPQAAPISAEEVREVEQHLRVKFPEDYRAFLLAHNGGQPTPGWVQYDKNETDVTLITQFYSLDKVESETQKLREYQVPNTLVPIADVNDEEFVMLSLAKKEYGTVYWNASNDNFDDNLIRLAGSFSDLFAKLDYVKGSKPWMMFIDNNDLPSLTQWLDGGGSANARDERVTGNSALEHAALTGRLEMVAMLLERGAKPRNAALYAEQAGFVDIVDLIRHGGTKNP